MQAARHPLIVIGAGANRKMTSNMLRHFVDDVGMAFCDTQQGKGVIDSRAPHSPPDRCMPGTCSLSMSFDIRTSSPHSGESLGLNMSNPLPCMLPARVAGDQTQQPGQAQATATPCMSLHAGSALCDGSDQRALAMQPDGRSMHDLRHCCARAGHPMYMGTAAISSSDYVHACIDHADLILMIGHDVVEKPPFFMAPSSSGRQGTQVVHINYFSAQVCRGLQGGGLPWPTLAQAAGGLACAVGVDAQTMRWMPACSVLCASCQNDCRVPVGVVQRQCH